MKKIKIILMALLILTLISTVKAYEEPPILIEEEEKPSFLRNLFVVTDISQAYAQFDTIQKQITREGYIDARILLEFNHDCEKYSVSFQYLDEFGGVGKVHTTVKNIPHKTGDKVYVTFKNLPTSGIPDSYCSHNIGGMATHRLWYNNAWHMTTNSYSSYTFKLNCETLTCTEQPIGDKYCSGYDVVRKWQYADCSIHTLPVQHCYPSTCQNGACVEPCETGVIGSEFCKNNAVYQRYGLGRIGGDCKFEDRLVTQCEFNQDCDAGACIDKLYCGNGVCDYGETYNSCPADCEKPWRCGDGNCNREDEDEESCPEDCEPPTPPQPPPILLILLILGATAGGIYFIIKK